MDIAERTAIESNCVKYKVGAVIVRDNVGGMVSCRLRDTFLSNYTELQAGGNA